MLIRGHIFDVWLNSGVPLWTNDYKLLDFCFINDGLAIKVLKYEFIISRYNKTTARDSGVQESGP